MLELILLVKQQFKVLISFKLLQQVHFFFLIFLIAFVQLFRLLQLFNLTFYLIFLQNSFIIQASFKTHLFVILFQLVFIRLFLMPLQFIIFFIRFFVIILSFLILFFIKVSFIKVFSPIRTIPMLFIFHFSLTVVVAVVVEVVADFGHLFFFDQNQFNMIFLFLHQEL